MQPGVTEIAYTFAGISGKKDYIERMEVCQSVVIFVVEAQYISDQNKNINIISIILI